MKVNMEKLKLNIKWKKKKVKVKVTKKPNQIKDKNPSPRIVNLKNENNYIELVF